jgi:non-homologous end joining protein Ku
MPTLSEIDDLYLVRPYYIVPDGKAGHDAYAVIREIPSDRSIRLRSAASY